jgi:hypothetical protein
MIVIKITNPRALYDAGIPIYKDKEGTERVTSLWVATQLYEAWIKPRVVESTSLTPETFSFEVPGGFASTCEP